MLVEHVMKSPVFTVDQNRSAREAAEVMKAEIESAIPESLTAKDSAKRFRK